MQESPSSGVESMTLEGVRGKGVRKPRKLGLEIEIFANSTTLEQRVEIRCAFWSRAVWRFSSDGRKELGNRGSFVVNHVIDAVRKC